MLSLNMVNFNIVLSFMNHIQELMELGDNLNNQEDMDLLNTKIVEMLAKREIKCRELI